MVESKVSFIVTTGKAYFSHAAKSPSGLFVSVGPVISVELNTDALVSAIERLKNAEPAKIPDPTPEFWRSYDDPILKATGAHSWKALAPIGTSYGIVWTDENIQIQMSKTDEKGRWVGDRSKNREFPLDTRLLDIVEVILEDIQARPELGAS